jgi:hypothetical protein
MPEIEVGLPAVVGDEHLSMLEGVHRPGVDVDVRVELLDDDPQPSRLEQPPERGGGDALAEAGHHTTGHEHVFGGASAACPGPVVGIGGPVGEELIRHGRPR